MIQPITAAEFRTQHYRGKERIPEFVELLALPVGEGFKTACHWAHNKSRTCGGSSTVHSIGRRNGMQFKTACKGGVFYVWREA